MFGTFSNPRPATAQQKKYDVQLLRQLSSGWVAKLPMLNATVTRTELILQPYGFNPPPAARIPGTYIRRVSSEPVDVFPAICIEMRGGSSFFLMVNWDQEEEFVNALRSFQVPSKLIQWQPQLPSIYVRRLIRQIMTL